MKKVAVKFSLVFLLFSSYIVFAPLSFARNANGNAGVGQDPTGGGCGSQNYFDTCHGVTWQGYLVVDAKGMNSENGGKGATMPYTNKTGGPVYIKGCKNGQTIYNLGFETFSPLPPHFQVATLTNKTYHQYNWQYLQAPVYGQGAFRLNNGTNTIYKYTTPTGYIDQNAVLRKYNRMKDWVRNHPHEPDYTNGTTWENVGWFCFDPAAEAGEVSDTLAVHIFNPDNSEHVLDSAHTNWGEHPSVTASAIGQNGKRYPVHFQHIVKGSQNYNNNSYFIMRYIDENGQATVERQGPFPVNSQWTHKYRKYITAPFRVCAQTVYTSSNPNQGFSEACAVVGDSTTIGPSQPPALSCEQHVPPEYKDSDIESGYTDSYSNVTSTFYTGESGGKTIYAKPGDKVAFKHCYFPGTQKPRKSTRNDKDHPDEGKTEEPGCHFIFAGCYSRDVPVEEHNEFSIIVSEGENFLKRKFDFQLNPNKSQVWHPRQRPVEYEGELGDSDIISVQTDEVDVIPRTVNQTIKQQFETYAGRNYTSECPEWYWPSWYWGRCCSDGHCHPCIKHCRAVGLHDPKHRCFNGFPIKEKSISSEAEVYVPYNYKNDAVGEFKNSLNYVYAGETVPALASVTTHPRPNQKTGSTMAPYYATFTPDTKVTFYSFYSDSKTSGGNEQSATDTNCSYYQKLGYKGCTEINQTNTILNPEGKIEGENKDFFYNIYNVHDIPAGYQFCVGVSIFPAESGADDISPDNGKTYFSAPECRVVAKKPAFQIWGGNFYSAGDVKTSLITKNNLKENDNFAYIDYTPTNRSETTLYGSWVEQAIIANGRVSNLASGASMGYTRPGLVADHGGSKEGTSLQFCKRSPLSFSNTVCSSGVVGSLSLTSVDRSIQNAIFNRFMTREKTPKVSGSVLLSSPSSYTEDPGPQAKATRFTYSNGNLTIRSNSPLPQGITHAIYSPSNITIDSNLTFLDTNYTNVNQIPQYVIYAKGDINISCHVEKLNAILVAEGKVNTCPGANTSPLNNPANSTKLEVYGFIIANRLILNRTYGSATGHHSITPAELIDLSPSVYYWATGNASDTPKLFSSYHRELAPRY